MRALRDLQDDTGGFQAFIPLPFLPGNTDFSYLPGPDPRGEAAHHRGGAPVPRLVPARQGPLGDARRGDHVGGARLRPRRPLGHAHRGAHRARHHRADAARPLAERMETLVRAGGKVPVERDTLYEPVERDEVAAGASAARGAGSVSERRYTLAEASALIGPLDEAHRSSCGEAREVIADREICRRAGRGPPAATAAARTASASPRPPWSSAAGSRQIERWGVVVRDLDTGICDFPARRERPRRLPVLARGRGAHRVVARAGHRLPGPAPRSTTRRLSVASAERAPAQAG